MNLTMRHPREQDLDELAAHLSEESKNGLYGREPRALLAESVRVSRLSEAVLVDGVLLFVWGVRELPDDVALGWFMTTEAVQQHKRIFWQTTKGCVDALKAKYRVVTNVIDWRNKGTILWAMRMGFTVYPATHLGGRFFHRAEIVRDEHV